MKKLISYALLTFTLCFAVFAGDVAEYCDLGFSSNGKYFVFAQYGVTDNDFVPYAEIYTVDIEKNEFVSDGIFIAHPNSSDMGKGGKALFENLYQKNKSYIDSHSGKKANLDSTLYLRGPESKDSSSTICFKDFSNSNDENEVYFYINLVKEVLGSGNNLKSSFFITVERKDQDGKVLSNQVAGNAGFQRKNIADYAIRRITFDSTGKYLIFEIEKKLVNESGTSFRYMVETLKLN